MKAASCPKCGCKRLLYKSGCLICTDCNHTIGKTFNKYGAKRTSYGGHIYDSKLEANYAEHFNTMLAAGELVKIERQVIIPLDAYGKHICNYKIDFILYYKDGTKEYAEVKGLAMDLWKMKWKLLEAKLTITEPGSTMVVYGSTNKKF